MLVRAHSAVRMDVAAAICAAVAKRTSASWSVSKLVKADCAVLRSPPSHAPLSPFATESETELRASATATRTRHDLSLTQARKASPTSPESEATVKIAGDDFRAFTRIDSCSVSSIRRM